MKIGILTYHFSNNYGAVLQAFALQDKLRQMGHATTVIDRTPIKRDWLHKLYYLFNPNSSFYWRRFRRFARQTFVPKTTPYLSDQALAADISRYELDAIIVGSDQIWRGRMCGLSYFLGFLPEDSSVRRYSYAASFGLSEWDTSRGDTEEIRALLSRFARISVRENSGVAICRNVFGLHAELMPDPTLLHPASFYERRIISSPPPMAKGKVVSYILGQSAIGMVASAGQFARSRNLPHKELYWLAKDLRRHGLTTDEPLSCHIEVAEWLREIRDAEYVITNSFHAAVFSILFHKRFVIVSYAAGGNDRLVTLLSRLGLDDRFCTTADEAAQRLDIPMDWAEVDTRLRAWRKEGEDFLARLDEAPAYSASI